MDAFKKFMSLFMTPHCYEDLFVHLNLTNVVCLRMIASKGLGYGILLGAMMLRVPQILKLLAAKSGKGISVLSEALMLIAIFGTMSYGYQSGYPIAAYGDTFFLYLQTSVILLMVLLYERQHALAAVALVSVVAATAALYAGLFSTQIIVGLNAVSVVLSVISRLNQAFANYRNGSTGALSAITIVLQFLGTVARIFTSIQETGDTNLVITYVINSFTNGILVAQLAYYWNADSAAAAKKKNKKKN